MPPKTRRHRVIHPIAWILGLIATITLVLAIAHPAYGCDPNTPTCQLETPEALADTGTALLTWLTITALAAFASGGILLALRWRHP